MVILVLIWLVFLGFVWCWRGVLVCKILLVVFRLTTSPLPLVSSLPHQFQPPPPIGVPFLVHSTKLKRLIVPCFCRTKNACNSTRFFSTRLFLSYPDSRKIKFLYIEQTFEELTTVTDPPISNENNILMLEYYPHARIISRFEDNERLFVCCNVQPNYNDVTKPIRNPNPNPNQTQTRQTPPKRLQCRHNARKRRTPTQTPERARYSPISP